MDSVKVGDLGHLPAELLPLSSEVGLDGHVAALASDGCWQQDHFWQGQLQLWQPKRRQGYRFNIDSVLLSAFAADCGGDDVLDLGAGIGIIAILLLASRRKRRAVLVERQALLCAMAQANLELNGLDKLATLIAADIREQQLPFSSCIVFNPPYWPKHSGRMAANPCNEAARREWHGTLQDFVAAAAAALTADGTICAVLPKAREQEALALLQANKLVPARLRYVFGRAQGPCTHVLLAAQFAHQQPVVQQLDDWLLHGPAGYPQALRPWLTGLA